MYFLRRIVAKLMDDDEESGASRQPSPKGPKLILAGITGHETVTIAVAGFLGVGKTSFIHRCAGMTVGTEYNSTKALQQFGMQVHSKDGGTVNVNFIDIPDGTTMRDARQTSYREADALVIMFDLTSLATLMYVKTNVFPEFMESRGLDIAYDDLGIPCMLVGNNLDQARIVQCGLPLREVSEGQAMEVANVIECPYRETSVLTGEGVQECFYEFLTTAVDFRMSPGPRKKNKKKKAKRKCNVQ